MKFVNASAPVSKEKLFSVMSNDAFVNSGVRFDKYIPEMKVKQSAKNNGRLRITCRIKNSPTKDNGFIVGTYFSGKITEKNGISTVKGVITTAPIYHLVLFALVAFFIYRCFSVGGFNPMPVVLVAFDVFMFWREFKKQGMIERYINRALRKAVNK